MRFYDTKLEFKFDVKEDGLVAEPYRQEIKDAVEYMIKHSCSFEDDKIVAVCGEYTDFDNTEVISKKDMVRFTEAFVIETIRGCGSRLLEEDFRGDFVEIRFIICNEEGAEGLHITLILGDNDSAQLKFLPIRKKELSLLKTKR